MKNNRPKILKDFSFLLEYKREMIEPQIVKYVIKPGRQFPISKLPQNFDAYFTIVGYDYTGKTCQHKSIKKINSFEEGPFKSAYFTMALKQQSWFNFQDFKKKNDHDDQKETDPQQSQTHEQSKNNSEQQIQISGMHHHVTLDRIEFKNSDSVKTKNLVYQQNRQKGKQLYGSGKYIEAARIYKGSINITEGISKKRYSNVEIQEIEEMNIKSKQNYLRCFVKIEKEINGDDDEYEQIKNNAENYVKFLVKQRPAEQITYFLKAKFQLYIRRLSDALDTAKLAYRMNPNQQTMKLIKEIEFEIENKNKIKVVKLSK